MVVLDTQTQSRKEEQAVRPLQKSIQKPRKAILKQKTSRISNEEVEKKSELKSLEVTLRKTECQVWSEREPQESAMRMRLMDWMEQFFSNYHLQDTTFFLTVQLFDRFVALKGDSHDAHLVMAVCLWLAVKFNEVKHFTLNYVHEIVTHKKYSPEDIRSTELLVMQTVGFEMLFQPSVYQMAVRLMTASSSALTDK